MSHPHQQIFTEDLGGHPGGTMCDPTRIGPFTILGRIGQGGMSVVYDAIDERNGGLRAIKTINRLAIDEIALLRFRREARSAMLLSHPQVIKTYGIEVHDGITVIVMERIIGIPLDAWMQDRGQVPPLDIAVSILRQILQGLQAMHAAGVLHRDLKPNNILIDDEQKVTIIDLGLARIDNEEAITEDGRVTGTVGFIAPELMLEGGEADCRTDLFSVGVVAYHLFTGVYPFPTSSPKAFEDQVQLGVPSLAQTHPHLPARIAELLDRLLRVDPLRRTPHVDFCLWFLDQQGREMAQHTERYRQFVATRQQVLRADMERVNQVSTSFRQALTKGESAKAEVILTEAQAMVAVLQDPSAKVLLLDQLEMLRGDLDQVRRGQWRKGVRRWISGWWSVVGGTRETGAMGDAAMMRGEPAAIRTPGSGPGVYRRKKPGNGTST